MEAATQRSLSPAGKAEAMEAATQRSLSPAGKAEAMEAAAQRGLPSPAQAEAAATCSTERGLELRQQQRTAPPAATPPVLAVLRC